MPDEMITALVSVGGTLLVSIITLIMNIVIEHFKAKLRIQQKEYESKRELLNSVYKELISIVNLYPNESPNDILKYIDGPPNYLMEHFDSLLESLDCQIEYYKKQLKIGYGQSNDIGVQISNREYAKKEIAKIRDKYFIAQDKYKSFCQSDKIIFDLYAGQDVRNNLVNFEVIIHNVFISGRKAGYKDDPQNNILQIARNNLVNSMRRDIGAS